MRIAVVHDWLTVYGGAERLLEQILAVFPAADVFALVDFLPPGKREWLGGRIPKTTFIQNLPFARRHFRKYIFLFPIAIEQLDLGGYDLIISSSHAVAKGVLAGPGQHHICYCHSPIRYAWDMQKTYLQDHGWQRGPMSWLLRLFLSRLRRWDRLSSMGVDEFIANSNFIRARIRRAYRRDAAVIHPPVDVARFGLCNGKDDYYFTASRLVPYKHVALIAEAFRSTPQRRLLIAGDGPEYAAIADIAKSAPNIKMMGYLSEAEMVDHMRKAKAFVYAAMEDFGIVLVEAAACGTPVIAYGKGGARDIVVDLSHASPTGVLYDEKSIESLRAALDHFESQPGRIVPEDCRRKAEAFSTERFHLELREFVEKSYAAWRAELDCKPRVP